MAEFVHLHVHSEFSLLDGAIRCRSLAAEAQKLGMRGVALTDHANMFGAIHHYKGCKAAGITPIIGCEVNVARTGEGAHGARPGDDPPLDHLVLIAENATGYRNLLRIVSRGHLEPVHSHLPSVTLETVAEDSAGLIALTGCMGGVVSQQILEHGEAAGRRMLERLTAAVPEGSLYVELQDHGMIEQPVLNRLLRDAAADMGLPIVASNDCHFLDKAGGEAQLYLQCIATGRAFADAVIRQVEQPGG